MRENNMNKKIMILILAVTVFTVIGSSSATVYLTHPTTEVYQIYQNPSDSDDYIEYDLERIQTNATSSAGQQDIFRMKEMSSVSDLSGTNKTVLTNPGNWEKAVQIKTDTGYYFLGGVHGYEKINGKYIYADGVRINPTRGTITECDELKIVITSNLLNPDNITQSLCKCITTYIWDGESLKINNKYEWKTTVLINIAYASMFPVSNAPNVSSMGRLYGDLNTIYHFQSGVNVGHVNSKGGIYFNHQNNRRLSMLIVNAATSLYNYAYNGNTKTYFKSNSYYNKLYVALISPPTTVTVYRGNTWNFTALYRVWNA